MKKELFYHAIFKWTDDGMFMLKTDRGLNTSFSIVIDETEDAERLMGLIMEAIWVKVSRVLQVNAQNHNIHLENLFLLNMKVLQAD